LTVTRPPTAHIRPAFPTFADLAGAHAARHGDALALVDGGREMRWAEFE
jgi:hypothetical protein